MSKLKYICTVLSLFLFILRASAVCIIHPDLLEKHNIYLRNVNGIFDIQGSDIVETDQRVYLFCYGKNLEEFVCQSNTNFNRPLEDYNCTSGFPPSVVVQNHPSCPAPYKLYAVGYHYNGHFMELYQNCYDVGKLAFKHSSYMTYRYTNNSERPTPSWATDDLANFITAYEGRATQACFLTNLGAKQPGCKFDRGHMTPASAFIFAEVKKATFRYINAIPQYLGVNRGYWKSIETWITSLVKEKDPINKIKPVWRTHDQIKVCTGVLEEVHALKHNHNNNMIPIYLMNNNKIPVPTWMYKTVTTLSGTQLVILTYNDNIRPSDLEINRICNTTACPSELPTNKRIVGHTVCCNHYDFISLNAAHLTGIC
ncbi:uncharacterized protein LOC108115942 [Drosophila eugracilis]|uniref:uncharacterized protein LOC108115942 n=1 Tax=Drosophila eugracilis TaxID=29029 RepID=UPI001BDA159F|nr:uncharacterized protein LOC108115942 [Drosophila eugracilis]